MPAREAGVSDEPRVTPLELFFDLVFVFALTQVTGLLADDPSWSGLARGLAVLGALWWAWVAYAWLTNTVDPDDGAVRIAMFAAMGGMLIVSLAVPGAFGDDALVFGVGYLAVRLLHLLLYALASREDPALRGAVRRLAVPLSIGPLLLLAAGFADGTAQAALWVAALTVDWMGPIIGGVRGWRVHAGHFAERHALIVIIALGESIVAIGVGAAGLELDAGLVVAALLGMAVAAALWWAYFDVVAPAAERRLHEASQDERVRLARDSYMYLHFPMIAGIVLLALGLKKVLAHVGDPLDVVPAAALGGGAAIYLLGHVAFRLRNMHSVSRQRVLAALGCLAVVPLGLTVPALAALAALAAVCAALIAYEAIRFADARRDLRGERPRS